ncbi:LOW QUALITY PROTEIN: mucin-2-like [Scylla paramamosain]|uniref:LOW QUALITY PROTEIN: mucin-2-like n=1 Tax=Scylla paramamosain TaxID=85552 RepID=UPI0030838E4A
MGEETKYCGNCKREVSSTNFTVHTVHCHRNIALCPLCKEPVPRSTFQQHLQTEHEEVRCPKCGAEMEPARVFAHEKEECPKRLLTCQHCELEVQASELQKHVEYCEARTERCKGCTKYVQVKHLQFHYESDHRYLRPEDKAGRNSSDDEASDECPICLGPFTLPLALECGHTFCMVCVKGIANTTKNCAICRRDIPRDMLMDVRFCREEEIIKNYVNKPRNKKNTRSHSVPNRSSYTATPTRRLVHHTTQDYDDMVNALLSSRTSSTSYRYQRPSNTHTPPSYTPYSSSTTSTTTSSTSSSSSTSCQESCQESCSENKESVNDDDCCCSSSSSSSSSPSSSPSSTSSTTTTTTSPSTRVNTTSSTTSSYTRPSTTTSSTTTTTTPRATTTTTTTTTRSTTVPATPRTTTAPSPSSSSSSSSSSTSSSPSSLSNGARPRRPTSLALETMSTLSSLSAATSPSSRTEDSTRTRPPRNATQEQYDRWLAFQLAKAEDDLPAAEFNRKHKPAFKRSLSMPERPLPRRSTRRPPASPRTLPSSSSSSSASSSSSTTPISKSSSDSNATTSSSSSSVLSTGARPKNTRLKKRVSFREETTPVRREAPVLLPCEFCDEMFSERDLMRHQTSCDKNETQLPRTSRLTPMSTPPTSPSSSASFIPSSTFSPSSSSSFIPAASSSSSAAAASSSATVSTAASSSAVTSSSATTSSSSSSSSSANTVRPRTAAPRPSVTTSARRSSAGTEASSRASPAPAPARTPASPQRRSPTLSPPPHAGTPPPATITIVDRPPPSVVVSAASVRPFSESPAPSASTSSASVCTSPSTSSSASPVPAPTSAPADTPTTDLEMEEMEEETPYMRPRRGRLLSSAIFSWRSISATGAASRRGYMRSNTAPLEDTGVDEDEEIPAPPVLTSLSATQLPPTSPEPQSTPPPGRRQAPSPPPARATPASPPTSRRPAPSPPPARPPPPASPPQSQERPETVFVKNPNKYRAPPPPQPPQPPAQPPQAPQTQAKTQTTTQPLQPTSQPSQAPQTQAKTQTPTPQPKTATTTATKTQTQQVKTFSSTTSTSSTTTTASSSSSSSSSTRKPTAPPPPKKQGEAKGSTQQLNGFRFDSQPMMVGGIEDGIPCEFCSKVLPSSKFQSHQTMCEAATRPPTLRPTSPAPAERPARPPRPWKSPKRVKPKAPSQQDTRRALLRRPLQRSSPRTPPSPPKGRRDTKLESPPPSGTEWRDPTPSWMSECATARRYESTDTCSEPTVSRSPVLAPASTKTPPPPAPPTAAPARVSPAGGAPERSYTATVWSPSSFAPSSCWGGSSSSLYGAGLSSSGVSSGLSSGYTSGHGWASPLSFLRDDVRGRLSSSSCAAAASSASSYYGGVRYRERSVSRARPTSLYTTSDAWGSLLDLHSPTRQFNIADTFSSASLAYMPTKRPSKKYRAPQPPCKTA